MQETVMPAGCQRGAPIPWWAKIAAKLVLRRLPIPHRIWSALNMFRHSYSSGCPAGPVLSMRKHVDWFKARTGRCPRVILELGPGEITTRAVVNKALGVDRTIFVDVGDFGTSRVSDYERVAEEARALGLSPPNLANARDRAEVLERCGAQYHTDGIASLERLAPASVDFILSEAVIEHVRRSSLQPLFEQLGRVQARDGLSWHSVDFQDHIGGRLENLRFPSWLWEQEWMATSGFYTNRVSASELVRLVEASGFSVELLARSRWTTAPTNRSRIAADLRPIWTDDDLSVQSITIVAQH